MGNELETFSAVDWWESVTFILQSNEAFAAHFSLYGTLKFNVAPTIGWSVYSLAASIVPRMVWADRPEDVYPYYAEQVGVNPDQGYTLHHATGWYLNFGFTGIIAGGLFVGWGFDLPMSVGAVAMSVSTIIVAANAQLLRRLKLRPAAR